MLLASDTAVAAMASRYLEAFGRIDVLHNNVGVYRLGGPTDLPEAEWGLVMACNLRSLFLTCRHVIPAMLEQGRGAIINIGSISGMGYMGIPQIAYATSKAAITAFTRSIAAQYGTCGIRANCVISGIVDTPVLALASEQVYAEQFQASSIASLRAARAETVPLGRLASAWDVAGASLFLASDEAQYIAGAELLVDGGLSTVLPQPPCT
jgi:NAD(P)-dependent dehydrogenase (short-subunit alcohol dehydrogenase family)